LLFGGAIQPRKAPIRLDPVLPRGEVRGYPVDAAPSKRLCSLVRPVCVDEAFGRVGLNLLTQAYEEHIYGLSLPAPLATEEHPLFYEQTSDRELRGRADPIASRGFDRAQPSCGASVLNISHARRCVVEAALLSRAPAGASWLRRGYGAYLSAELGAAPEVHEGLIAAAAEPQVGILSSTLRYEDARTDQVKTVSQLRSARFFAHLDERSHAPLGHAGFLALLLGATETRTGSPRWEAEPDLMDVIAATLEGDVSAIARFVDDFARYSYLHPVAPFPRPANSDQALSGMVDWVVEGATLPRSLVLSRPIEPTGSAYVKLHLSEQQRHKLIAVQTHCESPVSYVWSVLRLDEKGNRVGSIPIGYKERGTSVEARVEPMEGVRTLVFVGTNMGGVDVAHPFDPDHEPHEAHGCRLYLSVLEPTANSD
jgi:hypothetical protein